MGCGCVCRERDPSLFTGRVEKNRVTTHLGWLSRRNARAQDRDATGFVCERVALRCEGKEKSKKEDFFAFRLAQERKLEEKNQGGDE